MDTDLLSAVGMDDKLFGLDLCSSDTNMCDSYNSSSPWDNIGKMEDDDLSKFLDMESAFSEEFVNHLPQELEMPMLQDEPLLGQSLIDFPIDDSQHSDSSDSGIEFPKTLKSEPLSPMSSNSSELSLDSAQSYGSFLSSNSNQTFTSTDLTPQSDQISFEPSLTTVTVIKQEPITTINTPTSTVSLPISQPAVTVKVETPKPLTPPLTPTTGDGVSRTYLPQTATLNGTGNIVKLVLPSKTEVKTENGQTPEIIQVLNNKTKVLPKPIPNTGASKTLVLTPEEFVKLTSQKLLNIKTNPAAPQMTVNSGIIPQYKQKIPGLKPSHTCINTQQTDVKTLKRQQRMMKNRESACLSRKRKKEYLAALEKKLQQYTTENEQLKAENENLKKTITVLQSENSKLKKVLPSSIVKGTTVVLGILLLLSLNLGPLLSIVQDPLTSNIQRVGHTGPQSVHHGRTLLSFDYTDDTVDGFINTEQLDNEWEMLKSIHLRRDGVRAKDYSHNTSLKLAKQIDALTNPSICPTYFNSTESQRLLNELRGWVKGHEEEQKRQQHHHDNKIRNRYLKRSSSEYSKIRRQAEKLRPPPTNSHPNNMDHASDTQPDYGIQVFTGWEQQYRSFMKTLQRRNDTFYVVSFRQDHLLLPAIAHNKTMRPRMSLVMPATGLNATMEPPDGSIAMMQIDCEVTATKLVHIHKSAVPEHPNITQHPSMHQNNYYDSEDKEYEQKKRKQKHP